MRDWEREALDKALQQQREGMLDNVARMRPIRYSLEKIRAMSDDEIMGILSGEKKPVGTLYHDTLHFLSTELQRREIERSAKPHWTTIPAFVLSAIAAVAAVAGFVVSVLQWK